MGAAESKVTPSPAPSKKDDADAALEKKKAAESKTRVETPDNDYQLVFEAIKNIEYMIQTQFECNGEDLTDMITSMTRKLPKDLIIDLKALATIRNNMAHEYSFDRLPNRDAFIRRYQRCIDQLTEEVAKQKAEEESFYQDVVRKHRKMHPRPAGVELVESDVSDDDISEAVNKAQQKAGCCVACF